MSKKTIAKYVVMGFIGIELLCITSVFLCAVLHLPILCNMIGGIIYSGVKVLVKTCEFCVELLIVYHGYANAVIIPLINNSPIVISTIPAGLFLLMGFFATLCVVAMMIFYVITFGPILVAMQMVNWMTGAMPISV